ncbi:MAG: ABC transporter permease [Bacilli bacterium]|nr:ABC transporter permease [Bacilli bacterium]
MFLHNFKYTFKNLLRNKSLVFWSFAFPLILATLFNMAFSNIMNSEKLTTFDIAIINNEEFQNNQMYVEVFKQLESQDKKLFNIEYVDEEKAQELLEDDKIAGYLIMQDNKAKLVFSKNGINQTVLKYVIEEIDSTNIIFNNLVAHETNTNYEELYQNIMYKLNTNNVNITDKSNKNMNFMLIEFYTLIAMTCLYGGIIGMTAINQNLANMSNKGKRIEVSPTKKSTLILSSLLSSYIIQLIGLLMLFIYTIFILKVNYGNNLFLVILLSLVGSLTGLAMGLFIGVAFKKSEATKVGLLLAITMIGSFLSGMMGVTLKYVIDKNIPFINKLNPASMITDGFYSLYYYQTYSRYYFNLISLLMVSLILIVASIIILRRKKYDSI